MHGLLWQKNLILFGVTRMESRIDLSVIIVNYNTPDLTLRCLERVLASKKDTYTYEIIVVDNGSSDASKRILKNQKGIVFIDSPTNLGFAAGNNLGIGQSRGRYVVLLNSDTQVELETFHVMLGYMDGHPLVGATTCAVLLPDGGLDPACHRGFPTPWAALSYFLGLEKLFPRSKFFGQYHLGYQDMQVPHEIDSPSGAFFLVRREVLARVGSLDEDYFMYGEDLDLAFRIKKAGWNITYYPYVSLLHYKKQSGRASEDKKIQKRTNRYFYDTMLVFYKKHMKHKYPWIVYASIVLVLKCKSGLAK